MIVNFFNTLTDISHRRRSIVTSVLIFPNLVTPADNLVDHPLHLVRQQVHVIVGLVLLLLVRHQSAGRGGRPGKEGRGRAGRPEHLWCREGGRGLYLPVCRRRRAGAAEDEGRLVGGQRGGERALVDLVEVDQLFEARELCPSAVQRIESGAVLVHNLRTINIA